MKYRYLGKSGVRVSELCLGAMTFGEADEKSFMHNASADEKTSFAMMSKALDAGVNFWDTADVYGQDGLSERTIGKWLKDTGKRDDLVLATKCRFSMGPGPNDKGASRLHIKRAVEASLQRLGADRIDLMQIHQQDLYTPEEEVVRALDELVKEGKVHYFGASNYAAYRLVEHLWIADKRSLNAFITLQAQYNLIERNLEREHIPAMKKFGLGLLPWSPLASGLLSGKYKRNQAPEKGTRMDASEARRKLLDASTPEGERKWKITEAVNVAASEVGATPSQVALAWLLSRDTVSSVIIGVRTPQQLEDNLQASDLVLPAKVLAKLNEASEPPLFYPYDFMRRNDGGW